MERERLKQQLRQDQDKLQQDLSSGARNEQIAEDQRAIELDQQSMQDSLAASGDTDVVVTPGS